MLAGRPAFVGKTWDELREEILRREPKPLRQINGRIPISLERICQTCLRKVVAERYSTADDLANELRGFVSAQPVCAAPVATENRLPQQWTHKPTDDECYVEPSSALEWLDEQAADPRTRVIAIVGLDGMGKTAIVGHWLKRPGSRLRRYEPIPSC